MSHPWRALGLAGFLLTLAGLAVDTISRASPEEATEPGPPPPGGVAMELGGLGTAEALISGPLELVVESVAARPDGRLVRRPAVVARGLDPVREPGGWIRMREVLLRRMDQTGEEELFRVEAPTARFRIREGEATPALDTREPVKVLQPVVRSLTLLPGRLVELRAASAEVDPLTGAVNTLGSFLLDSAGLLLEGHGLRTGEEEGSLLFGAEGEAGEVRWELRNASGPGFSGGSDGGGSLHPAGEGHYLLELPGREASRIQMPPGSPMPGTLESLGLRVRLAEAAEAGWEVREAEGTGWTRWIGETGWLRGGPWSGTWLPGGVLLGFLVDGPLDGFLKEEGGVWIRARGGAWFTPGEEPAPGPAPPSPFHLPGSVYLFDRARVFNLEGRLHAGWILWKNEAPARPTASRDSDSLAALLGSSSAGGGVFLHSAAGSLLCRDLGADPDGGWRLGGPVLLLPGQGAGRALATPWLRISKDGRIATTEAGFDFAGRLDEQPWRLRGGNLTTERRESHTRTEATGEVVWTMPGAEFRGERLFSTQTEERTRFELGGRPANGVLHDERGEFGLSAERIDVQEGSLFLVGSPLLRLPAAALGLQGGPVEVRAPIVRRRADGSWSLTGGVRFTGGLEGSALRVDWRPDGGLDLEGLSETVELQGTRQETWFRFRAGQIRLEPDGGIHLLRRAEAEFRGGGWDLGDLGAGADLVKLTGENAFLGPDGGWFEGPAELLAGELQGQAGRIEWEAAEGRPAEIRFLGRAEIESPLAKGQGARIYYSPPTAVLRLEGSRVRAAQLQTEADRALVGDWIELNIREWLLSSGRGHWEDRKP